MTTYTLYADLRKFRLAPDLSERKYCVKSVRIHLSIRLKTDDSQESLDWDVLNPGRKRKSHDLPGLTQNEGRGIEPSPSQLALEGGGWSATRYGRFILGKDQSELW